MKSTITVLFLVVLLVKSSSFYAQTPRFRSGLIAGLNFSELEGKGITDYYGVNAGLLGTARLTKHSQLGLELLFSQNGEYILPKFYPAIQYGKVHLNHIEIPFYIDWMIGVFEKEEYYDWHLNLGFAYTRLLGYKVENIQKENVSSQIIYENDDAMLLQVGTTYHFTQNFGLNFKASLPLRIDGLSWTLAARAIYILH